MAPPARKLCLVMAWAWASAVASLSVSPQLSELSLPQGARKRLKFTINNEDANSPRTVRYYRVPFVQTEDGAYSLVSDSIPAYSCHEWFALETTEVTLRPGGGQEVFVDLAVPQGVSGTRYGAISFDMLPTAAPGAWSSIGLVMRMPAFVEVTIKSAGAKRKAELTSLEVVSAKTLQRQLPVSVKQNAAAVLVGLKNTGEVALPVHGRILLRDEQGRRYREFPLSGGGAVLPGAQVKLVSVTPQIKPGVYTVDANLGIGGLSPLKGSVPIEVTDEGGRTRGGLSTAPTLDLSVSTEVIEMSVPPKSTRTQYVVLRNDGIVERNLTARVKYLAGDQEGRLTESDSVTGAPDCRDWVVLDTQIVKVRPHSSQAVKVQFNVPETRPGGRYACLYLEDAASDPGDSTAPRASISIPVMLTVTGPHSRKVEIAQMKTAPAPLSAFVQLANLGEVHVRPSGHVQVKQSKVPDPVAEESYTNAGSFDLDEGAILLPGDTVVLSGQFAGSTPKGFYRLDCVVECGPGLSVRRSEKVVVK